MVKMKNAIFGVDMWVAEDRVEEYKAAGHKLVASESKAEEPTEQPKAKKAKSKK